MSDDLIKRLESLATAHEAMGHRPATATIRDAIERLKEANGLQTIIDDYQETNRTRRWVCRECGWVGTELLSAPNPFEKRYTIYGCPDCSTVGHIVEACDVEGCHMESSCGTPTEEGYRRTCSKHVPKGGLYGNIPNPRTP